MTGGNILVPTRPAADSTNAAASTAFVQASIAGIVFPASPIPSGTVMLFWQASAPTGWTQIVTQNDKAIRVVSGIGGASGGTNAFSTVFAQTVVGNTSLSTAQLASHAHGYTSPQAGANGPPGTCAAGPAASTTGTAGSGTSHNHTITMSIQFIDLILCSKN